LKIRGALFKEGVYDFDGADVGRDGETVRGYYPLKEFVGKKSLSQLLTVLVVEDRPMEIRRMQNFLQRI
jgi:hypothetical protein